MTPATLFTRLYSRVCCFVLFLVAASASFCGYYQKWHFGEADVPGDDIRASFEGMIDGTAYRPYVYRQLVPDLANWLDRTVPQSAKSWLYSHQGSGAEAYIYAISSSQTANSETYFFRYLVVYIVTFLFTMLAVFAMYRVCEASDVPSPAAVFAPVIVILLMPFFMTIGGFFYDFPELAFFALAVWMALQFDWWWIIPVAALGAWNKESFLLFIPTLYPLLRRRNSRRRAFTGVIVLSLVCLAVYSLLRVRFAHNPGGAVEVQWLDHLRLFLHPKRLLFATEETYGVRSLSAFTVLPLALLAWTMVRGWKYLPRAIQLHGKIALAINLPLYVLFCSPGELRNLSMLYIVFLLVAAGTLTSWIYPRWPDPPVTRQNP